MKIAAGLKTPEENWFGSAGPSGIGWGGNRGDPMEQEMSQGWEGEERGELGEFPLQLAVGNEGERSERRKS